MRDGDLLSWLEVELADQQAANSASFDREAALGELRSLAYRWAAERDLTWLTVADAERIADTPPERAQLTALFRRISQPLDEGGQT